MEHKCDYGIWPKLFARVLNANYLKNFTWPFHIFLNLFCLCEMLYYRAPWNFPLLVYFCVERFEFGFQRMNM